MATASFIFFTISRIRHRFINRFGTTMHILNRWFVLHQSFDSKQSADFTWAKQKWMFCFVPYHWKRFCCESIAVHACREPSNYFFYWLTIPYCLHNEDRYLFERGWNNLQFDVLLHYKKLFRRKIQRWFVRKLFENRSFHTSTSIPIIFNWILVQLAIGLSIDSLTPDIKVSNEYEW